MLKRKDLDYYFSRFTINSSTIKSPLDEVPRCECKVCVIFSFAMCICATFHLLMHFNFH